MLLRLSILFHLTQNSTINNHICFTTLQAPDAQVTQSGSHPSFNFPVNFPDPFSRSVQILTSLTGRFSFLSCLGENILTGIEDCEIGPTTIVCCARIKTKIFKTTTNDSNIYLKEQFSTVSISNQRFFCFYLTLLRDWLKSWRQPLNQSGGKLKTTATWSFVFSGASSSLLISL